MAEFHERKTYDVAHSNYHGKPIEEYACDTMQYDVKVGASKKNDCKCENEPKKQSNEVGEDKGLLIFTTKTCPNCKMAKAMLDKAGIAYTVIDAEDEREKTAEFGVKKAPTLFVPNGNGYDVYDNASKIKGWIEANK